MRGGGSPAPGLRRLAACTFLTGNLLPITASSTGGAAAFLPSGQYVIGRTVGVGKHDDEVQVEYFNVGGGLAAASPEFHYTGTTGEDGANAVAVQPNGQTVVGGSHYLATSVFGMARVNTNGSLDTTFGTRAPSPPTSRVTTGSAHWSSSPTATSSPLGRRRTTAPARQTWRWPATSDDRSRADRSLSVMG